MDIQVRRRWDGSENILLIGPGGAGKSSLAIELTPLMDGRCVDLDLEFSRRFGDIGAYIHEKGYGRYKSANAALAAELIDETARLKIFALSSGFLTSDNPPSVLQANQSLVASGYAICILPSRDLECAVNVIVERQMTRPFARGRAAEEATIRRRHPEYAGLGDLILFSIAPTLAIAQAVARHLRTDL
jgi:shikimate kinase